MSLDFKKFNTGTLFLVRTPEVFPEGYADKCFKDMKENLHFDYAALLETWNCEDGVVWKSDKYPRSSYWKNEDRDPIEECFQAADKYDMAFLPEAGMMHDEYMKSHPDGMMKSYNGEISRFGRIGLSTCCPKTYEYLIAKYDALIEKFGHHKSFQGLCLPSENGSSLSYDKYTVEAWEKEFSCKMPSPDEIGESKELQEKITTFLENNFLKLYKKLADYLKDKYNLPLMQYPLNKFSNNCYFQPATIYLNDNITLMNKVENLDLLNLQIHPPLNPNPYFYKFETEFLMANSGGKPCVADTHFYHEWSAGRLPDTTPKKMMDYTLSTLTPYGISFFCYGFMADELPLWKKELNPGAPVFKVYDEPNTVKARRQMLKKAMDFVEILRPLMENTIHQADCAIYYPESIDKENIYSAYALEHIFGLYELFNAGAIPVKMIDHIPESVEEQKLIVLHTLKFISDTDCNKLKKYIKSGGNLVIIGKCCEKIEEIAGISVKESNAIFVKSELSREFNHCYIRLTSDGRHYTELNGTPLLKYNDGKAAVTKLNNILYIGVSDEIDRFCYYRDFFLASWWKNYFTKEHLCSDIEFHNVYIKNDDWHQYVSCDIFENENKKLLFVRNFGVDHNNSTIKWILPDDMKIKNAWYDGVEFNFENGEKLPPFEHFIAIYAEKRR